MVLNESIYKSKQDFIHSRSIFQSYIDFDPQIVTHIQLLRVTKYSTIGTSTIEVGNAFNVRSSKDQVSEEWSTEKRGDLRGTSPLSRDMRLLVTSEQYIHISKQAA